MWKYRGRDRPPFAEKPEAGQESVWDYPRPPAVQTSDRLVEVKFGDRLLARSRKTFRVLETASPPGYYIPEDDVELKQLVISEEMSFCEWKGQARYWRIVSDPRNIPVGWSYPYPHLAYSMLKDCISFYPGRVDCFVDGEKVRPQPGRFYGGWITKDIVGPFKGEPGTEHW